MRGKRLIDREHPFWKTRKSVHHRARITVHAQTESVFTIRQNHRSRSDRICKGDATFPYFITLLKWGDKWCDPLNKGRPMKLMHKLCDKPLVPEVVCDACGGVLKAHEVEFGD